MGDKAPDYKNIEFRLHEYLVHIDKMMTLMEADEELLKDIRNDIELIRTKKYSVAVMGEFKRGKSSLINALLGLKILPADVEPATATINRITYGSKLRALVNFKDGTKKEVDIGELADYVTKLTPEGASRAALIEEAVVYSPVVLCQNHVDIIDTPGLNDNEEMTKITINMLNNVDAVIVTIHASIPFSETERNFICQLIKSEKINNIIFAVTYLDLLYEDEYDYNNFMEFLTNRIYTGVKEKLLNDKEPEQIINKADSLLKAPYICGVSSYLALKSFAANDRKMTEKSRFEIFKTNLMQIITSKQAQNAVQRTVHDIKTVISGLDDLHDKKTKHFKKIISDNAVHVQSLGEYCDNAGKKLAALFAVHDQQCAPIINALNRQKNLTVQGFIKELGKIKQNEHSIIENTMLSASLEHNKRINENILPTVKNELTARLKQIINNFESEYNNTLAAHIEGLNIKSKINISETIQEINNYINNEINKISFKWSLPPVPNVSDLSKVNVIDSVINAVDDSITGLINNLNKFQDSSRMFIFGGINNHTKNLKEFAETSELEIKNTIETKSKAFISNYTAFSKQAKEIIKNSELILKEAAQI